ncbi:carbon-nitrogen hydrolase family protein [Streptomyces sp. NBC_01465]|uniref:carbon-nitrogen hydrolase family protein n=1 Tax=Streptomyces sp. NBC_01465 TaxID=2903878 RepID=UPI002E34B091|nr:carbon-nitrogen hydrolase family protein [Streptomyces sp. NBC_01465]
MIFSVAQFTCRPGDIAANAEVMAGFVREAAREGSSLVGFAELALTGYELGLIARDRELWAEADDPRIDPVREACRETGTAAVVNCAAPAVGDSARPAITSYVYGPDGSLLTRYEKQHLYESERDLFAAGAVDGRFEVGGVRVALATCFDNHFPELAERAAADNCGVYMASSLYGLGNGEREVATVYPALAGANGLYVALANHVGRAGPYDACGLSALWAPDGSVLATMGADRSGPVSAQVRNGPLTDTEVTLADALLAGIAEEGPQAQ